MNEQPLTPTGEPKHQRSACERCRTHKLKCSRKSSDGRHDQCGRCAKAGLQCQTFPSLPPGRPRRDPDHGRPSSRRSHQKRTATQQACKPSHTGLREEASSHLPPQVGAFSHAALPIESFTADESRLQPPARSDVAEYAIGNIQSTTASSYETVNLNNDHDMGFYDFMTFPGLDGWSGIGQFTQLLGTNLPMSSQVDKRFHYLEKLTHLNAELLKHTANVDSTAPSTTQSSHQIASVGQMLSFVQSFLEVLKYYLMTFPIKSAPRVTKQSNADVDDDSEPEFGSREEELRIHMDSPESDGGNKSSTTQAVDSNEVRSVLDYPTALALSTGYISLVRLYRGWLQAMIGRLEKSARRVREFAAARHSAAKGDGHPEDHTANHVNSSQLFSDIPQVLPGVYLDGFDLGDYRSLQISVFMQVSMDLLWQAERGVAALVATDSTGSNTSSGSLQVLQAMLQQEARATTSTTPVQTQGNRRAVPEEVPEKIGLQSLKVLVRTIRKSLRSNVCLQLEEGTRSAGQGNVAW